MVDCNGRRVVDVEVGVAEAHDLVARAKFMNDRRAKLAPSSDDDDAHQVSGTDCRRVGVGELGDRVHDDALLFRRQLAVDRNGEALVRRALGLREIAGAIAEVGEARLQVERHGIVDLVADAARDRDAASADPARACG